MSLEKYFIQPQVSTEGFSDILSSVKKFFAKAKPKPGKRGDGKKPEYFLQELKSYSREFNDILAQLEKGVRATYANKKWLADQEFVTGDIKASDITSAFVLKGKVRTDFINAIQENDRNLSILYGPVRTACVAYGKQLAVLDAELCAKTRGWKVNDDTVPRVDALLNEAIAKAEKIGTAPFAAYLRAPGHYLPNYTLGLTKDGVKFKDTVKSVDTIPALDASGVEAHAKAMLALITNMRAYQNLSWYMQGSTEDDANDLRMFYDRCIVMDLYYDITHWQVLGNMWDPWKVIDGLTEVLLALEKLLDRSVK